MKECSQSTSHTAYMAQNKSYCQILLLPLLLIVVRTIVVFASMFVVNSSSTMVKRFLKHYELPSYD